MANLTRVNQLHLDDNRESHRAEHPDHQRALNFKKAETESNAAQKETI